jgi:hypothetical protein
LAGEVVDAIIGAIDAQAFGLDGEVDGLEKGVGGRTGL